MAYKQTIEDGKGNILEEKLLHSVETYKEHIKVELKEVWRNKFPTLEKQINLSLGLVSEPEASQLKQKIKLLLDEYEQMKIDLESAKTHEEVHKVLHK